MLPVLELLVVALKGRMGLDINHLACMVTPRPSPSASRQVKTEQDFLRISQRRSNRLSTHAIGEHKPQDDAQHTRGLVPLLFSLDLHYLLSLSYPSQQRA